MRQLLLFARARQLHAALPLALAVLVVTQLAADQVIPLQIVSGNLARPVPAAEAIPAISASLAGWACRPTLWQHERISVRHLSWLTAGVAVILMAIPTLAVLLAAPRYPQFGHWPAYTQNVLILAAVGLLAGVHLSPTASWLPPLALYLATIGAQQYWGNQMPAWWPLADPRSTTDDRLHLAIALALAAAAIQSATRGATIASSQRATAES